LKTAKKCYRPADMARLQLTLLGGFEARTDSGLSLAIPLKKAQMLLAYLAMHPKQSHLRDKLAMLLWDDAPAEQARLSLRQTLFAIRHAVPSDAMLLEGDSVAFGDEAVTVDVSEFEQLNRNDDPKARERAVALYQGELLEGISPGSAQFEEWLRGERERLHELALEAFAKLLGHQMKLEATEPAVQTALRLLSLDPLQEVTHRALMRLYARQGRRAAALRQYQLCVDVLQRELGVEPEEATKQVYRELLPTSPARVAASQAAPHALPQRRRRGLRSHQRSKRLTLPLIGRDAEVHRLTQALAKACASDGQVIALLGEAGIGKTRLIAALREVMARRGARTLIGQSHETERLLAFGPWVQAIREAGIVESRALESLGAGWIADLSYLFPELRQPEWPLPSEPIEALRLFDAMTELVKSLAARQPLALVLEDLHWADETSIRLFSFLGRRLEGRRILLVGTMREEELDGASPVRRMLAELSQEERLIRLGLTPLSREHTRVLVRNLAEGRTADESSLARLEDRVWTLSEGNPFVIVESLREVLEAVRRSTLPDLPALPAKVRELILGRFERLSEAGQRLLATAAVIGRDFEFRLLQRAADLGEADAASAVEALVRTHILHSVGERFDFIHDRLREVAYDRLLPTRRRMLHARVVAALENLYGVPDAVETVQQDRSSEHLEQLAYHSVRGDLADKAGAYLRQAGLRAYVRSAPHDARAWLEQALGVIETLPVSPSTMAQAFDIRLPLRVVLSYLGEHKQALERLRQAEALAEQLNDDRRRGQVCANLTDAHMALGELDEARMCGARALAIAGFLGDLDLRILATGYLELVHHVLAEYERVVELAKDNLAALPANRIYDTFGRNARASVFNRHHLILSLSQLGRFGEAAEHVGETIRIAEATHHAHTLGLAYLDALVLHAARGDFTTARVASEHMLSEVRKGNVVALLPLAVCHSARILAQLGETSAALNRVREGEQLVQRLAARGFVAALVNSMLAQACLLLGRLDDARRLANPAVESSVSRPGIRAAALYLLGAIATHPDRFDAESAEAKYREALALAEPRGMRPLVAHCHFGLGKLYRYAGQREQAREHLMTATTMYREMGMTYWPEQAAAEIAKV
jgi:predicted ATPase/DNA-binding SARP family transcriptional activator